MNDLPLAIPLFQGHASLYSGECGTTPTRMQVTGNHVKMTHCSKPGPITPMVGQ